MKKLDNKMNFDFNYDSKNDVLYICDSDKEVNESIEFSEDIVLDLDNDGRIIGIEIFYASELFNAFNKKINKKYLENLEEAYLEYKELRNMWFIVVVFKSKDKTLIYQPMPPLKKSEYISPLIASMK